jgi:hypothetical protein
VVELLIAKRRRREEEEVEKNCGGIFDFWFGKEKFRILKENGD